MSRHFTAEEVERQTADCRELHANGLGFVAIGKILKLGPATVERRVKGVRTPPLKEGGAPVAPTSTEKWNDGRVRFVRLRHKAKVGLDFIAEEANKEYPHLVRLTGSDVRAKLYGERL